MMPGITSEAISAYSSPMPIPASSYILISSLSLFVHPFVPLHTECIQGTRIFLHVGQLMLSQESGVTLVLPATNASVIRSTLITCLCITFRHHSDMPLKGRGRPNERTLTLRANEAPIQPLARIWKLAECRGIHVPY